MTTLFGLCPVSMSVFRLLLCLLLLPLASAAMAQQLVEAPQRDASGEVLVFADEALPQAGNFLPVERAFVLEYGWRDETTFAVRWSMPDGYYLYRDQIAVESEAFRVPPLPPAEPKVDEFFGDTHVYYDSLELELRLLAGAPAQSEMTLRWQGCASAGLCYLPQKRTLLINAPSIGGGVDSAPPRAMAEDEFLADTLANESLVWSLLLFLGLGLLLAFTPCVLPMVPILSALLVDAGKSRHGPLPLTATYVLAMASTYAAAGVAAASFGVGLQATLQSPWVLGTFILLVIALALSMFGLYDMQVPDRVQNWLIARSGRGGSPTRAAVMGALSALMVGPCAAPPLVGALLYIAQTGDRVLGGVALFSLGLGMGLPLLLAGAALGRLLPRSGAWMKRIEQAFGFMLLGLAIWFGERLFDEYWTGLAWAGLALAVALWLGWHGWRGWRSVAQWRSGGGALAAAQALAALFALGVAVQMLPSTEAQATDGSVYNMEVQSLQQLETVLASRQTPVVLDVYADWCIDCKRMSVEVLTRAEVRRALQDMVLLRADVTHNDAATGALLTQYGILGPPTLLFFDGSGRERRDLRVSGYLDAAPLLERLEQLRTSG